MSAPSSPGATAPQLAAVVVHWRGEDDLRALLASWPDDPRCELVVVDNSWGPSTEAGTETEVGIAATAGESAASGRARWVRPGRNLGFAGGVNAGVAASTAPAVLLLNPDARPGPGALGALLDGLAAHPEAAGLAPRLVGEDGAGQHAWQLRQLPGPVRLLGQVLMLPVGGGPAAEPPAGTAIEQPAAAALLLRRRALEAVGGLDERFYPAWFEDVDLARRLAARGESLLYWPSATFRHRLGATVPRLGYGRFLWLYYRNLVRYLTKHHGVGWALAARALLPVAAIARLALLPLRRPRRARSRGAAAGGLLALALAALSGWRLPRAWSRRFAPPAAGGGGTS